jgi:hypothetical protein
MFRTVSPLPVAVTLYRQPRKSSDVKCVLHAGIVLEVVERVPDFPGWWSVALWHTTNGTKKFKQGYINLPTATWHDGEAA